MGNTMKFITSGNPCMSRMKEAKTRPIPTKVKEIEHMNANDAIRPGTSFILNPSRVLNSRIITPCINAVVEPPAVLPSTMESLDTGATITSFRNPNSLSQSTEIPANTELKTIVIPTIPVVKNPVLVTPSGISGMAA